MSNLGSEQALADELYYIAQASASAHGRSFKPIADSAIRQLMQAASAEVFAPSQFGAESVREASLGLELRKDNARAAVAGLVDTMVSHAITVPGYATDQLGEQTLNHALSALGFCPCWPFC